MTKQPHYSLFVAFSTYAGWDAAAQLTEFWPTCRLHLMTYINHSSVTIYHKYTYKYSICT